MCAISYSKQLLTQVIIFDKFRKDFFRSMKKQPTFRDATTFLPAKWRLRNDCRNSILMVCHYPDQGSASDWLCRVVNLLQPIRSTTQIWVVTRHQYGISAVLTQMSFRGETSGGVANLSGYYFRQWQWLKRHRYLNSPDALNVCFGWWIFTFSKLR